MRVGYDYIGVGVGAIVFNDTGQVFLSQRGPKARNERGYWEFPGGTVEFGESLYQAIQREFLEEYDMGIDVKKILSVEDHILSDENQHWISVIFIANHVSGIPKILEPEKCTAIGWFFLSELPAPLSMVSQTNLRSYYTQFPEQESFAYGTLNQGSC